MNIFDRLNYGKRPRNIERLRALYEEQRRIRLESSYRKYEYTIFEFVNNYCFNNWRGKGECINVVDMLETVDYEVLCESAINDDDALGSLIELFYNFWYLANIKISQFEHDWSPVVLDKSSLADAKRILDEFLEELKKDVYYDKNNYRWLIVARRPDIYTIEKDVPEDASEDMYLYNYKDLKGNLLEKRKILSDLGRVLEPKRKKLASIQKSLAIDIFIMLNNLNIRHNNINGNNLNVAIETLPNEELEFLYDELYRKIVLAFGLLVDADKQKELNPYLNKIKNQ